MTAHIVQFPRDRMPVGARMAQTLVRNLTSQSDDVRANEARKARELRLLEKAREASREARAKGGDFVLAAMTAAFPMHATLKVNVVADMARGLDSQHVQDVYWKYLDAFRLGCSFYAAVKFADCEYRYQRERADKRRGNVLTIAKQARLILRFCRRYAPETLRPFVQPHAAEFPLAQA